MSANTVDGARPVPGPATKERQGSPLTRGVVVSYLSLIVLIPLAAVVWRSTDNGVGGFVEAISNPQAIAALWLTILASLAVVAINVVTGTLIAWVLVRDSFRGKGIVNAIIDLPFALPTIVAGLTLLTLYGPESPFGINIAYTRISVVAALLFVTLPFVARAVQPVLLELDRDMEEASVSLGASELQTFVRVILPNLLPAILSGAALAFARSVGEFGSVVLITGNTPFDTQVASVYIFGQLEGDNVPGAAAVSVLLLAISLLVLFAISLLNRWGTRHDR
ncbi:MAG: sulfate ABC transporter permease subunit CysT [Actinobacteria bacterium]|nr:sulfate ABC transporter permease subunit CysT [Actinomycetota bacterium]MCA1739914.1 sulfate ABC transporter permease subunit CysT [Actinomycetota bacterium]